MTQELQTTLCYSGYSMLRELPGRGVCGIMRFAFTTGIVAGLDEYGYIRRWCYAHYSDAVKALKAWDGAGNPPGDWIKSKGIGGEYSNSKQRQA